MEVKVIKNININKKWISRGTIFSVRYLPSSKMGFMNINPEYQITEGEYSGEVIPKDNFIFLEEVKSYTEKEYNNMKNDLLEQLKEEREKTSLAQEKYNVFLKAMNDYIKHYSVAKEVSEMLEEWLGESYEGSPEDDRNKFALKLINFIQEKLV